MTKNTTMSPTRLALLALGSVALLAAGCSTPVPLTIQPAGALTDTSKRPKLL